MKEPWDFIGMCVCVCLSAVLAQLWISSGHEPALGRVGATSLRHSDCVDWNGQCNDPDFSTSGPVWDGISLGAGVVIFEEVSQPALSLKAVDDMSANSKDGKEVNSY